jgi:SAM-dependent methyltransferase
MSTQVAESVKKSEATKGLLRCWCGANRWHPVFRGKRAGLAQCEICSCYQTDPPPITQDGQSEDFYTQYYAQLEMESHPLVDPARSRASGFWRVAEQFPPLQKVENNVVDIGSGDGHLCAELRGAGWPVVAGVDASSTRVARARRFYPEISFYEHSLSKTHLDENSFDLVVMEAVIEHLPEPLDQLRQLRRYTREGGRIVITTPNMDSGNFRFLGRRWTGMLAPHAHIFLFTQRAIKTALEKAGFEVELGGSFEDIHVTFGKLVKRFLSGDVKGAIWRAHQEVGTLYGRYIHQGPMLFAVGRAVSEKK